MLKLTLVLLAFLELIQYNDVLGFGTNCGIDIHSPEFPRKRLPVSDVEPNMRMAYFGDQMLGPQPYDALMLVKEFGAEFVIHVGDFDYESDPAAWEELVVSVLGEDLPYFATIGNHELNAWDGEGGYYDRLVRRAEHTNITEYCFGEFGINMACYFKGLLFVLSGVGTRGSGHEEFIDEVFSDYDVEHKICTWHKNQRLMQIEGKSDETGWEVFEICNDHGAMIVDGHGHSYCRTFQMSSYVNQQIENTAAGPESNPLTLEPGKTFHVLTGLAGKDARSSSSGRYENPWWANYTATDVSSLGMFSNYGPLLCIYNIDGTGLNNCRQVGRAGEEFDQFFFRSNIQNKKVDTSKSRKCLGQRIKRQVSDASKDLDFQTSGSPDCHSNTLNAKNTVVVQFEDLHIDESSEIEYAFLEFYGAEDSSGGVIKIEAELSPSHVSCDTQNVQKRLSQPIFWADDSSEWDKHDVWVTTDISPILKEVISTPEWKRGSSIAFHVTSDRDQFFTSYDKDRCTSPGLVVQLKSEC